MRTDPIKGKNPKFNTVSTLMFCAKNNLDIKYST